MLRVKLLKNIPLVNSALLMLQRLSIFAYAIDLLHIIGELPYSISYSPTYNKWESGRPKGITYTQCKNTRI
jgi:hypothetical protein